MSTPVKRGAFKRSCRTCGWSGAYDTAGRGDYAKRKHNCALQIAKAEKRGRGTARLAAVDRTPKNCHHKYANHQHGSYACYVHDKCRCHPCAAACAAWARHNTRQKAYGRWDNYVDAGPSRAHIRSLMAQGMGLKRIVATSSISQGLLWKLIYGKRQPDGTRTPSVRVRKDTEARILAIRLNLADGVSIDATGTRRRIQGLVCLGYSVSHIAERLGWTSANFHGLLAHQGQVTVATAKAVADLYDALSMTPNRASDHRGKIARSRAVRYAAAMGWVPPLAWDEDTIDDPYTEPEDADEVDEIAVGRALGGHRTAALTKPERTEVVRRWQSSGRPLAELERATGINPHRYLAKETA